MRIDKEGQHLLFIIPLTNNVILLGYENQRIEVVHRKMSVYLESRGAIKKSGYKAPIRIEKMQLYPTSNIRDNRCCWINIELLWGKSFSEHVAFLQQYNGTITKRDMVNMCIRILG